MTECFMFVIWAVHTCMSVRRSADRVQRALVQLLLLDAQLTHPGQQLRRRNEESGAQQEGKHIGFLSKGQKETFSHTSPPQLQTRGQRRTDAANLILNGLSEDDRLKYVQQFYRCSTTDHTVCLRMIFPVNHNFMNLFLFMTTWKTDQKPRKTDEA